MDFSSSSHSGLTENLQQPHSSGAGCLITTLHHGVKKDTVNQSLHQTIWIPPQHAKVTPRQAVVRLIRTFQAVWSREKGKRQTWPCQSWKKCLFLLFYAWRGISISRVIPVVLWYICQDIFQLKTSPSSPSLLKDPLKMLWDQALCSSCIQCSRKIQEFAM